VLSRLRRLSARQRGEIQLAADLASWVFAITLALLARWSFNVPWHRSASMFGVCIVVAMLAQAVIGRFTLLYRGRYRFGSFEEVSGVFVTAVTTSLSVAVADGGVAQLTERHRIPITVPLVAGALAVLLMMGTRYLWRDYLDRNRRRRASDGQPLIVLGAGDGGFQVVRSMLHDQFSPYLPVALLDDDPAKRNLRFFGLSVSGGRNKFGAAARATGATTLLIAIPSADAPLLRELTELAESEGLRVKVLPPVSELFDRVTVGHIRDIDMVDLLGRRQIETDIDAIAHYVRGRRVLVTGAGGSIGSELCRQLYRFEPAELMMLDRDESGLHGVQLSIHGRARLDSPDLLLADIRDVEQVQRIFEERRPEVVFHAAALKHLGLLERHPGESVKTNVWGTLTVLRAAQSVGVSHFVNISTDKAANPISVLGYSKRITERLTAQIATETAHGRYLSVRFGNVLGSRGSVLTSFTAQVAAGGPLTVTDPDVTRYFMTIQEAVQLVIQAGAIGRSAETLVLDMGSPVRILDVAERLAAQATRPIDIVYTGLMYGEKLHEDLFAAGEIDIRAVHPLVSHVAGSPVGSIEALGLDPWASHDHVVESLRSCAFSEDSDLLSPEAEYPESEYPESEYPEAEYPESEHAEGARL
jgi:FlaA1/EpsC-like NDP-sugar epimerase